MHAPHVTKFCKKHNEELYYSPDTGRVGCFICHGDWLKEDGKKMEEKIKAKGKGWHEVRDPVLGKARRHSEVAKGRRLEGAMKSPVASEYAGYIAMLKRMLAKAKINKNLRYALEEIKKALERGDLKLAADLSAVKSYIANDPKHTFNEDRKYNEKVLGETIYSKLDDMHFSLARRTGTIPSGMTIFSASGKQERQSSKRKHPVLEMMAADLREIMKEVERRRAAMGPLR